MSQTIKFNTTGVAPTAEEISKLELALGYKIPIDYLKLICDLDVHIPAKNVFDISGSDKDGIATFIQFDEMLSAYKIFSHNYSLSYLLPIIQTSCGNYVCLSLKSEDYGTVYFWDHELSCEDNLTKLSSSVSQFMAAIRPDAWELTEEEKSKKEIISVTGLSLDELQSFFAEKEKNHR